MKVIVLNQAQMCVDVIPISKERQRVYGEGDDFDAVGFLADLDFPMSDISWMVCTDEDDTVPVYWNCNEEPYKTL